jgi:hypothetical protein
MWKKLIAAVVAVGSIVVLTADPARANLSWTVTPSGPATGSALDFKIIDAVTGQGIVCTNASLSGTWQSGNVTGGPALGTMTGGLLGGCEIGIYPVTVSSTFSAWRIYPTAYNSPIMALVVNGVTFGFRGPGCSGTVAGTTSSSAPGQVTGTHSNLTHKLTLGTSSQLRYWNVAGCGALVGSGDDNASLTATYTLTPALTITSP